MYLTCKCGNEVWLVGVYPRCSKCGQLYNDKGKELDESEFKNIKAPIREHGCIVEFKGNETTE